MLIKLVLTADPLQQGARDYSRRDVLRRRVGMVEARRALPGRPRRGPDGLCQAASSGLERPDALG